MGLRLFTLLPLALLFLVSLGGVQAAITGQQYCNKYVCITGRHDSDQKLDYYTLEPPNGTSITLDRFGWIAIGFGTSMTNTPMIITWPNSDGSITLSQRQASGHIMPRVVSNPSRKASLLTSASFSNTSTTSITFSIPSLTGVNSSTNSTALIWAYSTQNPGSAAVDATIQQHLASGNTKIALLATLDSSIPSAPGSTMDPISGNTGSSGGGSTGSGSGSGNGTVSGGGSVEGGIIESGSSKNILIAHVVCGALATMAVLPIGILVPRIARGLTTSRWWFPVHAALNGILGFGLIVAAFAIARANFHDHGGFNSTHRKLGLTLFILAIFQTLLGLFTHYYQRTHRFQLSSGRGPSNYIHVILGQVVVGIGFGTVWAAIDEEWGRWNLSGNPNVGWKVGWGLIVAITAVAYIGGLYFIPRQKKNEAQRRRWASSTGSGPVHPPQQVVIHGKSGYPPPPPPPPPVHPMKSRNPAHAPASIPVAVARGPPTSPTRVVSPSSRTPAPAPASATRATSTTSAHPPPPKHPAGGTRRMPPPPT
ncbi:hypothetical protein IAU59_003948 [Kwoniella sp. CBS 9459]